MWGSDGEVEIRPAITNLFIIQLPNAAVRDQILEQRPWHIQNKPLIVRKWEPGMTNLECDLTRVPFWVHLRNIPLELFTKVGLSYIASAIGSPLYMDRVTAYHERLAYAKLCVEVDVNVEIPRTINVQMKDGHLVTIFVEVPWHPQKCNMCSTFGHKNKVCPKQSNETKMWVPKKKVDETVEAKKESVDIRQPDKGTIQSTTKENLLEQSSSFVACVKSVSPKNVSSLGKAGSMNRFEILDSVVMTDLLEEEPKVVGGLKLASRKPRAASAGVAEVMKSLKVNKKEPIDKGKKQSALVYLLETKVKQHNYQNINSKYFSGWNCLNNYLHAQNGRIWLLWKNPIQFSLIDLSNQSIIGIVDYNSQKFYLSVIDACNDGTDRKNLWKHQCRINQTIQNDPWMLAGDFNVTTQPTKSSNYDGSQAITADIRDFIELRNHISIFDHLSTGPLFTWSNKQQEGFLARKLDRVMVNDNWPTYFPTSSVEFLALEVSDHCPSLIQLQQVAFSPPKPFKFFNFWAKHPEFLNLVSQSWNEPISGRAMVLLFQKLKRLKTVLKRFNKEKFGGISSMVEKKRRELAEVQRINLSNTPSDGALSREKALELDLHSLLVAEESFYKQKSRITWIQEGDFNTKFFQKSVAARRNQNTILSLLDSDGKKLITFEQISEEAINYFKNLLGQTNPDVDGYSMEFLKELISESIPNHAVHELCRPITVEEIKSTIFSIGNDKALGSHGFTALFFKAA
ncbi:hypothetical protein DITRI_Ditri19aG0100900 [Diplodiscus trichospermus]